MSKDYMQMELGGKKRGLKFNMGTFRFIGEITGEDPLNFNTREDDLIGLYRIVRVVIEAALRANCLSKREDADFTTDQVNDWVSDLSVSQSKSVLTAFAAANTIEPELNGQDKKKQTIH